jgi:hypothetical protein
MAFEESAVAIGVSSWENLGQPHGVAANQREKVELLDGGGCARCSVGNIEQVVSILRRPKSPSSPA